MQVEGYEPFIVLCGEDRMLELLRPRLDLSFLKKIRKDLKHLTDRHRLKFLTNHIETPAIDRIEKLPRVKSPIRLHRFYHTKVASFAATRVAT